MPTAYSYIRFSTPEQASGDSYRRQTDAINAFAAEHGLTLADGAEYTFFDRGLSAYKAKHLDDEGQLKRFLDYVDEKKIEPGSWLLVESLDRLSREKVSVALPRFLDLLNKGITVVTLSDGRIYTSGANELDLIISIVHMSRAHEESKIKGQRVSAAWRNKKSDARNFLKPVTSKVPAWIKLNDSGAFEIIESKADIVRRMFDLCINGYGSTAIVRLFNEQGVPVISERKREGPMLWGNSSIKKILQSKTTIGEYQPGKRENGKQIDDGPPIANFYPAVIDESTFYQAQAAINNRLQFKATRQSKQFNVWQGIAKCFWCGGAMHLVNKGQQKGSKYLRCFNSARGGGCASKSVRSNRTEQAFMEILTKVDSLSLVQDSSKAIQKALDVASGQLAALNTRLVDAEASQADTPTKAGARILLQLETEQGRLQGEIEALTLQLANSRITNKDEFFSRLDLESYEGRNAANRLIKRLGLVVFIKQSDGETCYFIWESEHADEFISPEGPGYGSKFNLTQNKDGHCFVGAGDYKTLYRSVQQGEITPDQAVNLYYGEFGVPPVKYIDLPNFIEEGESGDIEDVPPAEYVQLKKD